MQTSKEIVSFSKKKTLLHPVKTGEHITHSCSITVFCSPMYTPASSNFEEEMKTHTTGYILTALLDLRAVLYEQ